MTASVAQVLLGRVCGWCRREQLRDARARFCSKRCRQAAFRLRLRRVAALGDGSEAPPGARFAYADPPYPGLAARYYRHEATYGGEVDHQALVARLQAGGYLGWALSTSSRALRDVLPLCPPEARVCAWTKAHGALPSTRGLHSTWEPLIVVGGRQRPPGVRDYLHAKPARGGGELPGRKPLAFCAWLFDCLGMVPGDSLDDLFPGTGIIGRAWAHLSPGAPADGRRFGSSPEAFGDVSRQYSGDVSSGAPDDGMGVRS